LWKATIALKRPKPALRSIVRWSNRLSEPNTSKVSHSKRYVPKDLADLLADCADTAQCLKSLKEVLRTSSEFVCDLRAKRLEWLKGQRMNLLAAMKAILDKGLWNIGMQHRGKKEKNLKNKEKKWLAASVAYIEAYEDGEDAEELGEKKGRRKGQ
jgi:hypothetical protein